MTRYDIQNGYWKQYDEKQEHVIYKLADSISDTDGSPRLNFSSMLH